jgi:hypothetical protein
MWRSERHGIAAADDCQNERDRSCGEQGFAMLVVKMSAGLIVAVTVCLVGFGLSVAVGPWIWRNEWAYAWDPDEGGALWRGFVRITPLGGPLLGLGALAALLFASGSAVLYAVGQVVGLAVMAVIALMITVILFNRPRSVVAPHLRTQPGAIGELLGRKVPPTAAPRHRPLRTRRRAR